MPVEIGRTTARKRIRLPSGEQVDVPVITKLSVVDPTDRYQETQFTVDNSAQSSRSVHVDTIYPSTPDGQQDKGGGGLQVERIDVWPILDATDRAQETQVSLDNVTGADLIPPHFSTHQRTHVVKYRGVSNPDVWIESELIDEIRVIDGSDRYQETWLVLNNPAIDDDAQADPSDPDIADTANGIDPPVRTDPFQNLINFRDVGTHPFYPPYAISVAFAALGTDSHGTYNIVPVMYAASSGQGGGGSGPYPAGETGFPSPVVPFWDIGVNPSTIELLNDSGTGLDQSNPGPDRSGSSFWGIQSGMPAMQSANSTDSVTSNSASGMVITTSPTSASFDYSGVEFVPYQHSHATGGTTGARNFLDYYPVVTTGQTGWKYVPEGTFFTDTEGHIWLMWKPVAT